MHSPFWFCSFGWNLHYTHQPRKHTCKYVLYDWNRLLHMTQTVLHVMMRAVDGRWRRSVDTTLTTSLDGVAVIYLLSTERLRFSFSVDDAYLFWDWIDFAKMTQPRCFVTYFIYIYFLYFIFYIILFIFFFQTQCRLTAIVLWHVLYHKVVLNVIIFHSYYMNCSKKGFFINYS